MVADSNHVAVTLTSDVAHVSSKKFIEIQATARCIFTLQHVCDMIKTHGQKLTSLLEIVEEKGTDTTLSFVLDDLQKQNLENLPPGGGIHSK